MPHTTVSPSQHDNRHISLGNDRGQNFDIFSGYFLQRNGTSAHRILGSVNQKGIPGALERYLDCVFLDGKYMK